MSASGRVITGISAAAVTALTAAVLTLTVPAAQREEGIVNDVYADPVHGWAVPTVCSGDTGPHVQRGQPRRTDAECFRLLAERHEVLVRRILACIAEERRATVDIGPVAALVMLGDNTGNPCDNSIMRDLNAGVPAAQFCRRFTEQVATWQPLKREQVQVPVRQPDGTTKLEWKFRVVADGPRVTGPVGWVLVRKTFPWAAKPVPVSCRDPLANCRGIVLRREREQRMCLGVP